MAFKSLDTSLQDVLVVVFRRKWLLTGVMLCTLVVAVGWVFLIRRDMYQVSAKVLVKIGYEQAASSNVSGAPLMITGERLQDVNSEAEILKSNDLLVLLVDRFGLDKPETPGSPPPGFLPRLRFQARRMVASLREWKDQLMIRAGLREAVPRRDMVIDELRKGLLVAAERNSNVISIALITPERTYAATLLNALLDAYQTFRLKLYQDRGAVAFFRNQAAASGAELQASEAGLRDFEKNWDISAIERQIEVLLTQISELEAQVREATIAFNETSDKSRRLEEQMQSADHNLGLLGVFPAASFPDILLQQLAALDREREALRMTELDNSLRVRNNRSQFKVVAATLAANLRSTAAERKSVLDARTAALARVRSELGALRDRRSEWTALKRKARILEENYYVYRKKLDEAVAMSAMEMNRMGNVMVVSQAADPVAPLGTRKLTLLGICLLVGLVVGLAWAAIAEFFDTRVYEVGTVEERLGTVLAVAPLAPRRRWLRRHEDE